MNWTRRFRIAAIMMVALQGGAQAQQARQSPEERARAQALLDAQVREVYGNKSLPPEKEAMRDIMAVARDTLTSADAAAERLMRAQRAQSTGVVIASARALSLDCARTNRTAVRVLDRIKPLRTTDPLGDRALQSYRTALGDVQRVAQDCQRITSVTVISAADGAKVAATAEQLSKSIDKYTAAQSGLMKVLEIPFLPKDYKDPLGGG